MLTPRDLRRFSAQRPPAVVLGGLNMTRAVGLARIPVIVASTEADSPAFDSRFCDACLLLPPLTHSTAAALDKLIGLGRRLAGALGRRVPLFYGDDDYLNLINENRACLARHYRFIANDPRVAAALLDKERFDGFTRERALPVPRTLAWSELHGASGPILVKPRLKLAFAASAVFIHLLGRAGKARLFATPGEVLANPHARALRDELVFQEYVPGDDRQIWSFHGYADEDSRVLAWFTGRKIRTYPALTGVSTYLELAHNEALATIGQEVVALAPLRGVFKLDFKQDRRSGRFLMLEINARFNLWHYLAAANGLNIPRIAYDYLMEKKAPSAMPRARSSRRWLNLRLDYRAYRDLAALGELRFSRWLVSILARRKVYDLFAWSDPLPFLRYCMRRMNRVPRVTARLMRRLFSTP